MRIVVVVFALLGVALGLSYEGYKTYKVVPKTETEHAFLRSLESNPNFDFWSHLNKVGNDVMVMVSPKAQTEFEEALKASKIVFETIIENVESTIQLEREYHRSKSPLKKGRIAFDQYLRHDEINAYLAQLAEDHPVQVTVSTIGQSYENRDINIIRISSGISSIVKPILFIDAGIHAREWIAPAVALYIINQLVENPDNAHLIRDLDWIILPSVNPDGYEYSWVYERLWRKTRSPGATCVGCDANRNFGWHWMEAGASNWECSETYAGNSAFSEIESQNVRDFLLKTPNVVGYLSFHSFGQYVLYPWSYADILPDNADELQSLGDQINNAIRAVNGTTYTVGSTTTTLYAAAGSSHDWAMGGAGINISYTIELPGGGIFGFDLPATEIQKVVVETFEGVKALGEYLATRRV